MDFKSDVLFYLGSFGLPFLLNLFSASFFPLPTSVFLSGYKMLPRVRLHFPQPLFFSSDYLLFDVIVKDMLVFI